MQEPLHGIVHGAANGTLSHLPLEDVHITVFVVDVSARVTLCQKFSNVSELATGRAKYVFPVPGRAAVCAFEMHFADGRVITGISKEKELAEAEYRTANHQGKASGLVTWVTDDVFTISLGSIPARQTVTTKLVFVLDLMDDELKDQVRLQLPMSVGSRYGVEPTALANATSASSKTRLRIAVDIQMSGVIQQLSSPSHPGITLVPYVTTTGQTSRRRKTVKFRSSAFLTQGFVLLIQADGLDSPRCFAERDPRDLGTVALQLTMVPKIKLPPIPAQEYIFLVDRSGSMSGASMETSKRALTLLLHMLPNAQTMFNIFSFGTDVSSFWPNSQAYSQHSLASASEHIRSMSADYGGTEMNRALQHVFSKCNSGVPTVAFVLTDGAVTSVDEVINTVSHAVALASSNAPLRVFSLGIGIHVSSAVVEGIARAGNGECYFAVESEAIIGKCSKLLRAGRSSFVEDISIDWGIPEGTQDRSTGNRVPFSVNFSDSVPVQLAPPPVLQQTPHQITKIFPGMRFIVFALISQRRIPRQVVLRGRLNDGEGRIEIVVPVSSVRLFNEKSPNIPLVHTLAARQLITDLVEDRAPLPIALTPPTSTEDIRKAAVVRLGVQYQLASRHTSFVAVDDGAELLHRGSRGRHRGPRRDPPDPPRNDQNGESFGETALTYTLDAFSTFFSAILNFFEGDVARGRAQTTRPPGAYSNTSSPSASPSPEFIDPPGDEQEMEYDSTDTFSTLSSLEGSSSDESPERPPPLSSEDAVRMRSPSPEIDVASATSNSHSHRGPQPSSAPPPPVPQQILTLVELQVFDGSFTLSQALGNIVGQTALQKPPDVEDDTLWATVLAVAYLRKHLAHDGQSDLLHGLLDKVMESMVDEATKARFEMLVGRARDLVA